YKVLKVPSIPVYGVKDDSEIEQNIDTANFSKAIYAELFGISRKAIDYTLKTDNIKDDLVETASSQGKRVLKDSVQVNVMDNNIIVEDGTKGRKYLKYRQYRHYAKTCQNA
ncbi:hypothetical protein RhiirA4_489263, partial [Rhizophagus irregularis]